MKFKKKSPFHKEVREFKRFAWLPVTLGNSTTIWLENYYVERRFWMPDCYWADTLKLPYQKD